MSDDVLSQQTHRRALVGVPWQLAAAGTWEGNAQDWLPATTWPAETQRKAAVALAPPPAPVPRVEVWKLCSQGPHAGRTGS